MRLADISMGDFWGVEKICPQIDDNKGISLVICRTEKGNSIFESIKTSLEIEDVDYDTAVQSNIAEIKSVKKPKERLFFFKDLNRMNLKQIEKKYLTESVFLVIKKSMKNAIKSLIHIKNGGLQ